MTTNPETLADRRNAAIAWLGDRWVLAPEIPGNLRLPLEQVLAIRDVAQTRRDYRIAAKINTGASLVIFVVVWLAAQQWWSV